MESKYRVFYIPALMNTSFSFTLGKENKSRYALPTGYISLMARRNIIALVQDRTTDINTLQSTLIAEKSRHIRRILVKLVKQNYCPFDLP